MTRQQDSAVTAICADEDCNIIVTGDHSKSVGITAALFENRRRVLSEFNITDANEFERYQYETYLYRVSLAFAVNVIILAIPR